MNAGRIVFERGGRMATVGPSPDAETTEAPGAMPLHAPADSSGKRAQHAGYRMQKCHHWSSLLSWYLKTYSKVRERYSIRDVPHFRAPHQKQNGECLRATRASPVHERMSRFELPQVVPIRQP